MSFLEPEDINKEYEKHEDELKKLREERREHILKHTHYNKLTFSSDIIKIPFCIGDDNDYLIDGTKAYDVVDKDEIKDKNDFIYINNDAYFYRGRTPEEDKFMKDYYKLVKYKTIKSIDNYKPNTNNIFTIEIFNKLKESLKDELIKKKEEEKQQQINDYTVEDSKNRLINLIDNYDYNKQINKINQDLQKELKKKDIEYNPDLYDKHYLQLHPKPKPKNTLSFKLDNNGYPYRSYYKLKSLYDDFDRTKYKKEIKHFNNYNVKDNKEKYSLKTYSNVKYSFIGDIFFESNKAAFLLLININTRYAYSYQLGEIETKEVINIDENNKEYEMKYATKGRKTTKELLKAFNSFLKDCPNVNILRFDGERAIGSEEFKQYLNNKHIKFIPAIPNVHTSLSLIDRLCRTIRDIAFNLNYEGIYTQQIMNKILNYYNNSRHETLTQTLFKAYPELKNIYKFISPYIMEHNNENLETLFVKECIKYNYLIKSKPDYKINNNEVVKVVNDNSKLQKKRTIINKDDYKIKNQIGNIFEVKNTRTNETTFKPRYFIKRIKQQDYNILDYLNDLF